MGDNVADPFPKVEFDWEMLLGKRDHRCFGMTGLSNVISIHMCEADKIHDDALDKSGNHPTRG